MLGMLCSAFHIMFWFMLWGWGCSKMLGGSFQGVLFSLALLLRIKIVIVFRICLSYTSILLRLIPNKYSFFASLTSMAASFFPSHMRKPASAVETFVRSLGNMGRTFLGTKSIADLSFSLILAGAFRKDRIGQSSIARSSEHRILCCRCTRWEGKI
jgi:hypothetical protein